MSSSLRLVALSAALAGCAALLWCVGPAPAAALAVLHHPQAAVNTLGADAVALTVTDLACWLVLGWLGAAVLLAVASALPGAVGRLADGVAALAVPLPLRQILAVTVGAGVAGGVLGGVAGSAVGCGMASAAVASAPASHGAADGLGRISLDWPVSDAAGAVTVRAGDTLWGIAARHLPSTANEADVAAAWPRWYAANRDVIGSDPALLLPGEQLSVPRGG